jgi:hypothetical protein
MGESVAPLGPACRKLAEQLYVPALVLVTKMTAPSYKGGTPHGLV